MKVYTDPTSGEWVAEYETRDAVGEVTRRTEWFKVEADALRFSRTGLMPDNDGESVNLASAYRVEVKTQLSGHKYRVHWTDGNDRLIANYTLVLTDEGMVWIYTTEHSVGLYKLDRFGGALTPNNIRQFFLKLSPQT